MRFSADLRQELAAARSQTAQLFGLLDPAALYDRPIPERHRLIFYAGHVDAFDWNLLGRRLLDRPSFHSTFDNLFERGIDPEPGMLPSDRPEDWPSVEEVRGYSWRAQDEVDALWNETPREIRQMAIEHRQMHAETLTYMLHNLAAEKKARQPQQDLQVAAPPRGEMISIPAGCVTLGKPQDGEFGWDNEYQESRIFVQGFRIMKYKVTNRDYLEFVRDGGAAPHFWERQGSSWVYRGMFGLEAMPLDAPVYVTWDQANAYAQWRGMELPSEAEYHRAAFGKADGEVDSVPAVAADFQFWDAVSVNSTPADENYFGLAQVCGNGWEWTSTVFAPFAGFAASPLYPGYSADFFDGKHFVVKGASTRTAAQLTRRSFRNWYRPEYPYTYTGFRLIEK